MSQAWDNFKQYAEILAKDKNGKFEIHLPDGIVISGPTSALPGIVYDYHTRELLEKNIASGPIAIEILVERITRFRTTSGPSPEDVVEMN